MLACGDPKLCAPLMRNTTRWFPMRVTYNREMKVKAELDRLDIENFIPMQYKIVDTREGRKRMLQPAIHNLIFVHATQNQLTTLKQTRKALEPLRYMRRTNTANRLGEIIWVSDRQMENFMLVARKEDDSIIYLDYDQLAGKEGRRVTIIEGPFAGVEGTIERIQRNRRVVVKLEGVAAVAITFVPPRFLMDAEQ